MGHAQPRALSSLVADAPSSFGICISIRITSNRLRSNAVRASSPSGTANTLAPSKFSILEVVNSVVSLQKGQLLAHDIEVVIGGKDFEYYGSRPELQQCLLNLVSNSKDAYDEKNVKKKVIRIEINPCTITISDNAGGIDSENMERVFEPYFTTKSHEKGTGLGLYMCKAIIEDNFGGKLMLENVDAKNGRGLKITIDLTPVKS